MLIKLSCIFFYGANFQNCFAIFINKITTYSKLSVIWYPHLQDSQATERNSKENMPFIKLLKNLCCDMHMSAHNPIVPPAVTQSTARYSSGPGAIQYMCCAALL
jgi:hypothetical protein